MKLIDSKIKVTVIGVIDIINEKLTKVISIPRKVWNTSRKIYDDNNENIFESSEVPIYFFYTKGKKLKILFIIIILL